MADVTVILCVAFDHRTSAGDVDDFKHLLRQTPHCQSVLCVSGAFDLVVEIRCTSLSEHALLMENLRSPLAQIAARIETCFVSEEMRRSVAEGAASVWLPCEGGRRRVNVQAIDRVSAEGDYMRVHVGSWNALVHSTMGRLVEQLPDCFIRLHRSCLVREDCIEQVTHRQQRWFATLKDGEEVPIARSHVHATLDRLGVESSMHGGHSSTEEPMIESLMQINETQR